jgi:pyruvate formate lyase activating enzyme
VSLNKKMTRKKFLRSAGFFGFYAWLMSSGIGCFLKNSDNLPVADNASNSSLLESTSDSAAVNALPQIKPEKNIEHYAADKLVEAKFFSAMDNNAVKCQLCFRYCIIPEGGRGFCQARENREGRLYTLTYGKPVAIHIDPVEKEPLFHVRPGTDSLCVGTACCNLRCKNCINWHIAHKAPEEVESLSMMPEEIIETALGRNVNTICFTYNEPTQQYEYIHDIALKAREKRMQISFHSNGGMNPHALEAIIPLVDSVSIDLKAFDADIYNRLTGGELQPVLDSLKLIREQGVWLEIVCLLIPGWTDDLEVIKRSCLWIRDNLGEETPIHYSRFFPTCQLAGLPPTSLSILEQARDIAREAGLHYVYINNVAGHEYGHTYCPQCSEILVKRKGLLIQQNNIEHGKCIFCGYLIPGIWN